MSMEFVSSTGEWLESLNSELTSVIDEMISSLDMDTKAFTNSLDYGNVEFEKNGWYIQFTVSHKVVAKFPLNEDWTFEFFFQPESLNFDVTALVESRVTFFDVEGEPDA